MERILLVEDDSAIYQPLTSFLRGEGFAVRQASGQREALALLETEEFDLVLLDVGLRDGNGFSVCSAVKQRGGTAVIFLSASGDEYSVVTGLDLGADDYIAKPFGIMEFLARVRALLRRGEPREMITVRGVTLYPAARRVESSGQDVQLTAKEFNLLEYLMRRAGTVIRREELLEAVWGYSGGEETRTVDVHIRSLRLKLGEEGGGVIRTVRGVGYMAEEA